MNGADEPRIQWVSGVRFYWKQLAGVRAWMTNVEIVRQVGRDRLMHPRFSLGALVPSPHPIASPPTRTWCTCTCTSSEGANVGIELRSLHGSLYESRVSSFSIFRTNVHHLFFGRLGARQLVAALKHCVTRQSGSCKFSAKVSLSADKTSSPVCPDRDTCSAFLLSAMLLLLPLIPPPSRYHQLNEAEG